MSFISPRNYQIGTCFICQLCMYCGIDLTSNNCNCHKTVKPTKKKHTDQVSNYKNLSYKPNKIHEEIKKTISFSNQKYGYKLNMELAHNCILCSACNSQMNRDVKAADKNKKFIIISSPIDDTSLQTPLSSIPSNIPSTPSQIEFKLRLSIKQNKKVLPFVIISFNLENPNFMDFRNKLESYICEQVGLVLSNEDAFDEFLKDYQSITAGNKKVVIIVTFKESSKRQSHQVFIILNIIY